MDLRSILIMHAALYPKMQVQDMYKLVYQNEFGGGHLVSDEQESLRRLLAEHEYIRQAGRKIPEGYQFIDIGNGLCRLDLSVLEHTAISPSTANRFFVNTSKEVKGFIPGFEKKLDVLGHCCSTGEVGFPPADLKAFLDTYRIKGYPMVSHSEIYRTEYFPAYRVVKTDYRKYLEAFLEIDRLMRSKKRAVVAIDGNSGAGKSFLANLIAGVYDCNLFHMDDFFLRPEQRTEERLNKAGEFVDHERFSQEVIQGLKSGRPFSYRKFDCGRMALGETVYVRPKKLNVIEGSYSMHPYLAENYDLKIFLRIDPGRQEQRIRERNGEEILQRFLGEWIPRENKYFEEMGIREQCHLVFEE